MTKKNCAVGRRQTRYGTSTPRRHAKQASSEQQAAAPVASQMAWLMWGKGASLRSHLREMGFFLCDSRATTRWAEITVENRAGHGTALGKIGAVARLLQSSDYGPPMFVICAECAGGGMNSSDLSAGR